MATPTSGMKLQSNAVEAKRLSMEGDLFAIGILRDTAKRSDVAFPERKRLWNAHSRLITRVVTSLGITNVNSPESTLARELVGLASKGVQL